MDRFELSDIYSHRSPDDSGATSNDPVASMTTQTLESHSQTEHAFTSFPDPQAARKMRVMEARVFRGPNLYAYRPVIRIKLDLGDLEYRPTDQLPGFTERLLEL